MSSGHGGNLVRLARKYGCKPGDILDFSANLNPLGPPPGLRDILSRHIGELVHYPDPDSTLFLERVARTWNLDPAMLVAGNGTSELLFTTVRSLPVRRGVVPVPCYIDYESACRVCGLPVERLFLSPDNGFAVDLEELGNMLRPGDLVFLGQPANPTGVVTDHHTLLTCIQSHPDVFFIVDEAFAGFVSGLHSLAGAADNLITLHSLTKIFAIPGLRLGFLAAAPSLAGRIRAQLAPWSVNTLAQACGTAFLDKKEYLSRTVTVTGELRERLGGELARFSGLSVFPGQANYLLLRSSTIAADELAHRLMADHRIAIRTCGNYPGLDLSYFRVAVRPQEDNRALVAALEQLLARPGITGPDRKNKNRSRNSRSPARARSIMFVGTGSDVGKSVLAAALCRVLLQEGVRVAPFKAQNMSLNSYVTRDGGEMGRAQVVQAQACRLDPDVRMNPVLLKPSSDVGSQVIVLGSPVGNMRVDEYVRYKEKAWQEVCRAYDELAMEFDVLVLEGAGSPGEVNLKSHDIVNMRMARYAESPVLLTGDIDRGGVYASFVGHLEVMDEWERQLVAGFLVNRFRGDSSLLASAHDYILERTGKPVLGVLPYIRDLGLPQEDSVSFKAGLFDKPVPDQVHVTLALIDLPHISNFTDVEPLLAEPDVDLRIIRRAEDLGCPDAVILPGSKNVINDITYLQESGLAGLICELAGRGCEIVGICGGFQMLGREIGDPLGLEGEPGSVCCGLGLLEMRTELAPEKTLIRRQGIHVPSGSPVHGYEIHHGVTSTRGEPLLVFEDNATCGLAADPEGALRVWGSYLHGVFDSDPFRRWFINRLRREKGLEPLSGPGATYDLEPALDRLAGVFRAHVDLDELFRLLAL
ncbi:cobyric acid synthase [Desulfolithobacter sp.]